MLEVLLWEDVPKLGKRGTIVKVSEGYARNFLLPRKLASPSNKETIKQLENYKKRMQKEEEKRAQVFKKLAGEIENTSCTLEVKANEEGVLYGSITNQMIADVMNKEGWTKITPEMIELEAPIKELGVYRPTVTLYPGVKANFRLWIVEESLDEKKTK
jgi:large subunit ribosomal protein L9